MVASHIESNYFKATGENEDILCVLRTTTFCCGYGDFISSVLVSKHCKVDGDTQWDEVNFC